ncbi:hypothetical protein CYY_000235 [Polysphondylium violaceum]|uniref:Uncharacterized protein n=1 Tax=Polysphondylium violaceum TaxID=133409 RepID=A0A8J4Q395_9MYCE|nr:hypothetical protein CYY_000235 [Polysphondylium violaceum]
MDSFYVIWRNKYIRNLIRNLQFQGRVIYVDGQYLTDNHQFLSLFSETDKLNYNISIGFTDTNYNYSNSQYKSTINDVELLLDYKNNTYDLNQFSDGFVNKLRLETDEKTTVLGTFPESLTSLNLDGSYRYQSSPAVQYLLSNLPRNLKTLVLGRGYQHTGENVVLPESLSDLQYTSFCSNFKRFVVSPNKVFKNCLLRIESTKDFEWLHQNPWITSICFISGRLKLDSPNTIPSHVKSITIESGVMDQSFFPKMLESLNCTMISSPKILSHFAHLKKLTLKNCKIKLEADTLPQSLEYFNVRYDLPLEVGVLPQNLTTLLMRQFNHNLDMGVLPNTLTILHINKFNQPLIPNVLPNGLKELSMDNFNQPTLPTHSLPITLTNVNLNSFKGSFASCQPLDHLKKLKLYSIDPSLSTILTNVKRLDLAIPTMNYPNGTCLANTSIESLFINCLFPSNIVPSSLYANSLPPTLKYLTLSNMDLQSKDLLPNGCIYLKSYCTDINPAFIPPSVHYYFHKKMRSNIKSTEIVGLTSLIPMVPINKYQY